MTLILRDPTGLLFLLRDETRLTLPSLPVLYADTATRTARRLTDSVVGLHSVGGLLAPLEGRVFYTSQGSPVIAAFFVAYLRPHQPLSQVAGFWLPLKEVLRQEAKSTLLQAFLSDLIRMEVTADRPDQPA